MGNKKYFKDHLINPPNQPHLVADGTVEYVVVRLRDNEPLSRWSCATSAVAIDALISEADYAWNGSSTFVIERHVEVPVESLDDEGAMQLLDDVSPIPRRASVGIWPVGERSSLYIVSSGGVTFSTAKLADAEAKARQFWNDGKGDPASIRLREIEMIVGIQPDNKLGQVWYSPTYDQTSMLAARRAVRRPAAHAHAVDTSTSVVRGGTGGTHGAHRGAPRAPRADEIMELWDAAVRSRGGEDAEADDSVLGDVGAEFDGPPDGDLETEFELTFAVAEEVLQKVTLAAIGLRRDLRESEHGSVVIPAAPEGEISEQSGPPAGTGPPPTPASATYALGTAFAVYKRPGWPHRAHVREVHLLTRNGEVMESPPPRDPEDAHAHRVAWAVPNRDGQLEVVAPMNRRETVETAQMRGALLRERGIARQALLVDTRRERQPLETDLQLSQADPLGL